MLTQQKKTRDKGGTRLPHNYSFFPLGHGKFWNFWWLVGSQHEETTEAQLLQLPLQPTPLFSLLFLTFSHSCFILGDTHAHTHTSHHIPVGVLIAAEIRLNQHNREKELSGLCRDGASGWTAVGTRSSNHSATTNIPQKQRDTLERKGREKPCRIPRKSLSRFGFHSLAVCFSTFGAPLCQLRADFVKTTHQQLCHPSHNNEGGSLTAKLLY